MLAHRYFLGLKLGSFSSLELGFDIVGSLSADRFLRPRFGPKSD